jgi:hypothetical protein
MALTICSNLSLWEEMDDVDVERQELATHGGHNGDTRLKGTRGLSRYAG